MEFEVKKSEDTCLVIHKGDFNIYGVSKFLTELKSLVGSNNKIALDLGQVTEMDTAGLQALVALKKECVKHGKQLKLINHSHAVIKMIDLLGLIGFFGDKIKISPEERDRYSFKYGIKKQRVI
jgi:anti-anti-sigma factor